VFTSLSVEDLLILTWSSDFVVKGWLTQKKDKPWYIEQLNLFLMFVQAQKKDPR